MIDKDLWNFAESRSVVVGEKIVRETMRRYLLRKTSAGLLPTPRMKVPRGWVEKAWKNQKGLCKRCRDPLHLKDAVGDHWIPLAKGGEHKQRNISALCAKCNAEKNANDPIKESKLTGETVLQQIPYQDESDV